MRKSLVLVSGGMDSTYAAIWAMMNSIPTTFLYFDYSQRGCQYERRASYGIYKYCVERLHQKELAWMACRISLPSSKDMLHRAGVQDPTAQDDQGNPATFVPGRNMIMLSLAANLAYEQKVDAIVGGWTSVDVDYPDCSPDFLLSMQSSICLALGKPIGGIQVLAPVLYLPKATLIKNSEDHHMNVPWHLTRSCYGDHLEPCGSCDSCLVRAKAFATLGKADPIYTDKHWTIVLERLETYGTPTHATANTETSST